MSIQDQPRLPPLPPQEWPPEMRDALAPLATDVPRPPDAPKGLNVLGTFAHHPALTKGFMAFNAHVLNHSTLSDRQRELLVLRVSTLRESPYEWEQHRRIALHDAGITTEEIEAIRQGPDTPAWSTFESALLRAVDELLASAMISDDTWATLAEGLDERQLLDVIFTVGAYDVLSMALNSCGTPLDDDLLN